MDTVFSAILRKYREEAGFKTAYAFYNNNGGKDIFRFSYRLYLAMEDGRRLPAFKYLPVLLHGLRLVPLTAEASQLISAWLEQKLGKDSFTYLLKPLLKDPPQPSIASPLHRALERSLAGKKAYLTPEQMDAISGSKANFLCWTALSNDTGQWTPEKLGNNLKLAASEVKTALNRLAAAKLVKKTSSGSYKCPLAGEMIEFPRQNVVRSAKKLRDLRNELISGGEEIYSRRGILRAETADFFRYFPLLSLNLSTAQTYAVTEKKQKTAIFAVECKVVKIRDF